MSQAQIDGRVSPAPTGLWRNLCPDYFVDSVYEVDSEWLADRSLKALMIDVDNTIMPRNASQPGPQLKKWVLALRGAGIPMLVVSNNWSARVKLIAQDLDLNLIAPAGKPLASAFVRALNELGLPRGQTAIIGDQVFTDVLGGNRSGLASILVPPLGIVDLPHTKVLRVFEKWLLQRLAGQVLRDGKWCEA